MRLAAETIAFILDHGEAKVLITDAEFSDTVKQALATSKANPIVIDIADPLAEANGELLRELDYEVLLETGDEDFDWRSPADEW